MDRTKRYIKIFVLLSILAGMSFGFLMGLRFGFWKGALSGIIFAGGWGVMMALLLIPLDYFLTRKHPSDALSVHQTRELQVDGDFDQVFVKCFEILKGLKRIKEITPLKNEMRIAARTKKNLLTFGEDISLQFSVLEQGLIKINISSNPSFSRTLIDYGANYRNVEWIKERLTAL